MGKQTSIRTRRPESWRSLDSEGAAILQVLRQRGSAIELSADETGRRLVVFVSKSRRFVRLCRVAASEPLRVRAMKALGLNVTQAALRLGIPQPKASRLLRGYAEGFSTGKMLAFLTKLGQDVRVVVSDAAGKSTTGRFVITRVPATGAGRGRRKAPSLRP